MRLFLLAAAVLLGIAVFLVATTGLLAGVGPLGWAIFGLFAWVLDALFGGYVAARVATPTVNTAPRNTA